MITLIYTTMSDFIDSNTGNFGRQDGRIIFENRQQARLNDLFINRFGDISRKLLVFEGDNEEPRFEPLEPPNPNIDEDEDEKVKKVKKVKKPKKDRKPSRIPLDLLDLANKEQFLSKKQDDVNTERFKTLKEGEIFGQAGGVFEKLGVGQTPRLVSRATKGQLFVTKKGKTSVEGLCGTPECKVVAGGFKSINNLNQGVDINNCIACKRFKDPFKDQKAEIAKNRKLVKENEERLLELNDDKLITLNNQRKEDGLRRLKTLPPSERIETLPISKADEKRQNRQESRVEVALQNIPGFNFISEVKFGRGKGFKRGDFVNVIKGTKNVLVVECDEKGCQKSSHKKAEERRQFIREQHPTFKFHFLHFNPDRFVGGEDGNTTFETFDEGSKTSKVRNRRAFRNRIPILRERVKQKIRQARREGFEEFFKDHDDVDRGDKGRTNLFFTGFKIGDKRRPRGNVNAFDPTISDVGSFSSVSDFDLEVFNRVNKDNEDEEKRLRAKRLLVLDRGENVLRGVVDARRLDRRRPLAERELLIEEDRVRRRSLNKILKGNNDDISNRDKDFMIDLESIDNIRNQRVQDQLDVVRTNLQGQPRREPKSLLKRDIKSKITREDRINVRRELRNEGIKRFSKNDPFDKDMAKDILKQMLDRRENNRDHFEPPTDSEDDQLDIFRGVRQIEITSEEEEEVARKVRVRTGKSKEKLFQESKMKKKKLEKKERREKKERKEVRDKEKKKSKIKKKRRN